MSRTEELKDILHEAAIEWTDKYGESDRPLADMFAVLARVALDYFTRESEVVVEAVNIPHSPAWIVEVPSPGRWRVMREKE